MVSLRPIYNYIFPSMNTFFWTNAPCGHKVKIRSDGSIAFVHNPTLNDMVLDKVVAYVGEETTVTYVKVPWERDVVTQKEVFPQVDNNCGNGDQPTGPCTLTDDEQCVCTVQVTKTFVFDTLPTREEILSTLHVGAFDPTAYADDPYSLIESSMDVEAFAAASSPKVGSISTVFKVTDEIGDVVYFKNIASTVVIGGKYPMRKPVGFIDPAKMDRRDAEYEIE